MEDFVNGGLRLVLGEGGKKLTDMAMHEPHSRVVRLESNGQITSYGQKGHVPSWRIVKVKGVDARVDVVSLTALGKNDEIVAVEVHRMVGLNGCLYGEIRDQRPGDDQVHVPVRKVLRNDGVLWVEGGVVEVQYGRVGEVEEHGGVGQVPSRVSYVPVAGGGGRINQSFKSVLEYIVHCVVINLPGHHRLKARHRWVGAC